MMSLFYRPPECYAACPHRPVLQAGVDCFRLSTHAAQDNFDVTGTIQSLTLFWGLCYQVKIVDFSAITYSPRK